MEFRILGPLYADAGTGDGPAVISQPLLQSALAVLLLRANRPCPRSMLVEALWGAEPPVSPEAALRVCVSRLRRCLGACAERLESVGPPGGSSPGHRQQRGYMIMVRPGELDVDEFTDLAEQGQAELDSGNPAAAANYLVQALALWGDPPLPDLPASEVIGPAIARLRNHRQAVVDTLIDARLAAGEHERVLGQLRVALLAHPGRERTCAQLMNACHALGLRKEALDAYQLARQATLEQQGAEPGQALAFLYRQILAEEMATAGPAPRGSGRRPGGTRLAGPQAPAPPADFTGRSAEISAVLTGLTGPGVPVVVLTGGPGTGKSAIACAVAPAVRDRFADGQLYVELGGVLAPRDPQDVLAGILQTLGVPGHGIPAAGPARAALYRSLIAGRKLLLIADNAATAAQLRPLIPGPGAAAVLVTSRSMLSGLAGATTIETGRLPGEDSLALLGSAAGPGRVSREQRACNDIVAACAGLPLAVRLAGTYLAAHPGVTAASIAAQLRSPRALDVLTAEDVSVAVAIGSSVSTLSGPAKNVLWLAAATMADDMPGWALSVLAGDDGTIADQLVAAGLLRPGRAEVAGSRYFLHPLTRAFVCRDRHQASQHDCSALSLLRSCWIHAAQKAAAHMPTPPRFALPPGLCPLPLPPESGLPAELSAQLFGEGALRWLECERANLLAVVAQAGAAGDLLTARALARSLFPYECVTGRQAEAIRTWRAVGAAAATHDDAAGVAESDHYQALAHRS